ncbi:rac gtpase [Pelomyxa schiedti]|nr:rac gtpase [Pelomyxa schiedti]
MDHPDDMCYGIKAVFVGDPGVGKTALIIVMTCNSFPSDGYNPTVFDNYSAMVSVDGTKFCVGLWDTMGYDDYARLRPLSYPGTDIFVVCFSIMNRESFDHVTTNWLPEIRRSSPMAPLLLVGLKSDLFYGPHSSRDSPVSFEEGVTLSKKINAYGYLHTSALKHIGAVDVLQEITRGAQCRSCPHAKSSMFSFPWFSKSEPPVAKKPVRHDHTTNFAWTSLNPGIPRYGHSSVLLRNVMYVFGGSNSRHETQNCEILRFDILSQKWLPPVPLSPEFCGTIFACCVAHSGHLFAFGGRSSMYSNKIIVGNCDSSKLGFSVKFIESPTSPSARFGSTAVAYNSSMILFGGFNSTASTASDELYSVSLSDLQWTLFEHGTEPHFVPSRYHHTALVHKNGMLIFGGIASNGSWLNDLWRLDLVNLPACQQLCQKGASPPPLRGHSACVVRDFMFIFGCPQNCVDSKLFQLDLNSMYWTELTVENSPIARDFHSMVSYDNRHIFLFGGQRRTTNPDDVLCDCYGLDLGCSGTDVLPRDTWLEIFSHLNFVALIQLTQTCRLFHELARSEPLWTKAYRGEWVLTPSPRVLWKNSTFTCDSHKPPIVPAPVSSFFSKEVCFGPNATFSVQNNNTPVKMCDLKVGTKVECADGSFQEVECIWRCRLQEAQSHLLITVSEAGRGIVEITPDHPVCHKGKWCLPGELMGQQPAVRGDVDCVYNMVVTSRCSVLVGGTVECCTLGQPVGPPLYDPVWSSEVIVECLKRRPDFPYVVTTCAKSLASEERN